MYFYCSCYGFEFQKAFQLRMLTVLFYVMFVFKCVLYYCHRVATQLQLTFVVFMYSYCYVCSVLCILFSSCKLALFGYPD